MRFLTADVCFFLCATVNAGCCFLYYLVHRRTRNERSRLFELILLNLLLNSVATLVTCLMEPLTSPDVNIFNRIQNFSLSFYFALHNLLAPMFSLYVLLVNNGERRWTKSTVFWFLSPALLLELVVLTNPLTGLIFFFQDNVLYVRGPLDLFVYASSMGYLAYAFYQIFLYRKVLQKPILGALYFFFFCSIVGVMTQFFFVWLKIELFSESIALWGIMLLIELEASEGPGKIFGKKTFLRDGKNYINSGRKYLVSIFTFFSYRSFFLRPDEALVDRSMQTIIDWIEGQSGGTLYRLSQNKVALLSFSDRKTAELFVEHFKTMLAGMNADAHDGYVPLAANVDIVSVPDEIASLEHLASIGDEARAECKQGVNVRSTEDIAKMKRKFDLETVLQRAIHNESFEVYYQPIWNVDSGRFDSAEALVRLQDPGFGFISPMEFIPIAEQNGMINDIGRIVFEKVCEFWQRRKPAQFGLKEVSVNLSVFQLYSENIESTFRAIMNKYGVTPRNLCLEVTESASIAENDVAKRHFENLRNMGFVFSLDDFGTGYANLVQVIYNNFKHIKLEKLLLWDKNNANSQKLLLEMINMIRKFRLSVIQECVETEEQLNLVTKAGANKIQGYYFSKPLDEDAFIEFIRSRNPNLTSVGVGGGGILFR